MTKAQENKAKAFIDYSARQDTTGEMCKGFSAGWDAAHLATVSEACVSFRSSMRQAANLLNRIKRGAGEIIDIEKSVEAFRKSLMQ